jgi:hypothetical protein
MSAFSKYPFFGDRTHLAKVGGAAKGGVFIIRAILYREMDGAVAATIREGLASLSRLRGDPAQRGAEDV